MSDPRIPPVQTVSAHWNDSTNDPVTSPGLKLTPEQLLLLRSVEAANQPSVPTVDYVREKVAVVSRRIDDEAGYIDKVLAKVKALGALLVASVGLTASVLVGLDVRAQSKVDAGVVPIVEAQKKLDARVGALEHGQQRAELTAMRQTVMLEQLTEKARLPVPPPALLPDGGR